MIPIDARRVEQDLVLHYRSAEAGVVGYSMNRSISPLDHPVFNGFQFLRTSGRDFPAHSDRRGHWG